MSNTPFPPLYPARGFASRIYLPNQADLDALGNKMPYAFVLYDSAATESTGSVPAQQTRRGFTSQPDGCYVTHLVASSSAAAGFAFQVYDTLRKELWTPTPINFQNGFGTAQKPMFLKRIFKLPANAQLQCRVINLATAVNIIQVVAWGVRDE